eukprot:sb/3471291/
MLYVIGTILWGILDLVWKQPPLMNPSRRTLTLSASFYHLLTHITHTSSLSPLPSSSPPWAHSNSPIILSCSSPSPAFYLPLFPLLSPSLPSHPIPSRVFLRVFWAVGLFRLEFLFISVVQFPWSLWSRLWSVELPLSKLGIPGGPLTLLCWLLPPLASSVLFRPLPQGRLGGGRERVCFCHKKGDW